eukprot:14637168-Ditylum_brightwellii.AAC.1
MVQTNKRTQSYSEYAQHRAKKLAAQEHQNLILRGTVAQTGHPLVQNIDNSKISIGSTLCEAARVVANKQAEKSAAKPKHAIITEAGNEDDKIAGYKLDQKHLKE